MANHLSPDGNGEPSASVPGNVSLTDNINIVDYNDIPRRSSNISERGVLELQELPTHDDDTLSTGSISSEEYRITIRRTVSQTKKPYKGIWGRIRRFWTHNVVLTVPHQKNRDYFALERTFLAYVRTSVVIAMQGVLIAQLFRLQRTTASHAPFGFYEVGIPLSVTYHSAAVFTALLGAHRFWKQQNAIALGKVYAGGWELNCIGLLIGLLTLVTLILSIMISVFLGRQPQSRN